MSDKRVKITAYVMVPVTIEINVTSTPPNEGRLYRGWFDDQLECAVKSFTEEHVKVEDGFVDVTNFEIGDESGGCHLSPYHDRDVVKRLTDSTEAKLVLYEKIKAAMKVTNDE